MAGTLNAIARTGLIAPIAAAVTVALFILMQILIRTDTIPRMERSEPARISIAEYVPETEVIRIVPEPVPTELMPEIPRLALETAVPDGAIAAVTQRQIQIGNPTIDTESLRAAELNQDPQPLVRVEPAYPARPASQGVEGMCFVEFDVLGSGLTANVRVLQCDPGFERATIQAVQRWRYSASTRVGPGEIALRGLHTRLDYRLD